jgi:hypothetical protein
MTTNTFGQLFLRPVIASPRMTAHLILLRAAAGTAATAATGTSAAMRLRLRELVPALGRVRLELGEGRERGRRRGPLLLLRVQASLEKVRGRQVRIEPQRIVDTQQRVVKALHAIEHVREVVVRARVGREQFDCGKGNGQRREWSDERWKLIHQAQEQKRPSVEDAR